MSRLNRGLQQLTKTLKLALTDGVPAAVQGHAVEEDQTAVMVMHPVIMWPVRAPTN